MLGDNNTKLGIVSIILLVLISAMIGIIIEEKESTKILSNNNRMVSDEVLFSNGIDSQENYILKTTEEKASENNMDKNILDYTMMNEIDILDKDKASPKDRIKESQIKVYEDRIVIEIKNAQWSRFTDTKSMDPVIDSGANAIQIVPENEDQIEIGDIISFETKYTDGIIIHRVIAKETDKDGTYFITKGDNNENPDPEKIRFSQIKRVLIAIIY